ncbi:formylglycine-generating enzyme family protein [Chloroflexi bacterium TSY]|nr:formylglycine-generating enzyme family protein [Chloroflexi bacterium TSY]
MKRLLYLLIILVIGNQILLDDTQAAELSATTASESKVPTNQNSSNLLVEILSTLSFEELDEQVQNPLPASERQIIQIPDPTPDISVPVSPSISGTAELGQTITFPPSEPDPASIENNDPPILPNIISIPSGNFIMGSSDADRQLALAECNAIEGNCQAIWFDSEVSQNTMYIGDFQITATEITNAMYNRCVAAGVCGQAGRSVADDNIRYNKELFNDDHPVVGVNWWDAQTFCQWVGGRLPTEFEWEKTARGNTNRRYPWGDQFEFGVANLHTGVPSPVGSYPMSASPYGVMDMAGGVFEWTASASDAQYIVRGGSWFSYSFRGRISDRGTKLVPDSSNYDIGFRCAFDSVIQLRSAPPINSTSQQSALTDTTSTNNEQTPILQPPPSNSIDQSSQDGLILDFENWGRWRRGDEPYGTFTQSNETTHSGQYAGRLDYGFPANEPRNYVVFRQTIPIRGRPDALGLWVNGDGSRHFVNVWVQDARNQIWQFTFGRIEHTGWEEMIAPLDLSLGWPNQPIANASTSQIVYPIRFYALVLDGYQEDIAFGGSIYVDDLTSIDLSSP